MRYIILATTFITLIVLNGCSKLYDPDEPGNLVPKTVAEDPLLPSLEINGTTLHLETFGNISDPIIIFLNGGPGVDYRCFISELGSENASRYPEERTVTNRGLCRLADRYFCVFFDQRGAGLSPRFNMGQLDFQILVSDLDALVDHYLQEKFNNTGIQDSTVILFGHSFGGLLATGYTNQFPEKVKDVIAYEPGPFTKAAFEKIHMTLPLAMIGQPKLDEWLMSLDHLTDGDHARADYQQALGASRFMPEFHENENIPFWRIGAVMSMDIDDYGSVIEGDNLIGNLSAFRGRFLFMYSESVGNEFPGYGELQTGYYPESQTLSIQGTGHGGPWEKAEEVVNGIRNFLNE